jgi:hypothetical protein
MEAGPGGMQNLLLHQITLCRPAPLPPDFERLVILNHVAEATGRNGEGSAFLLWKWKPPGPASLNPA